MGAQVWCVGPYAWLSQKAIYWHLGMAILWWEAALCVVVCLSVHWAPALGDRHPSTCNPANQPKMLPDLVPSHLISKIGECQNSSPMPFLPLVNIYFFFHLVLCIYLFLFLRQGILEPRLVSNLLCSHIWPWIPDHLVSATQMMSSQVCVTILGFSRATSQACTLGTNVISISDINKWALRGGAS